MKSKLHEEYWVEFLQTIRPSSNLFYAYDTGMNEDL